MNNKITLNKKNHEPSISAPAYLDLYDLLCDKNIKIDKSEINIDRNELLNIEKRIPVSMEAQLWDIAKRYGAPDHIGLIAGSQINEDAKGVVSHLVSYSKDLKEALSFFTKYIRLMSDNENIEIISIEGGRRIYFNVEYRTFNNISSLERSMAALLTWGRYLTGVNIVPWKVCFQFSQPKYIEEYTKHFGGSCCFDQEKNYMDVCEEDFSLKIITANNYIKSVLEDRADKLHETIDTDQSLVKKVRGEIESSLFTGYFSSSDIAEQLNMSRQTLHRRLKEYGVSFKILLEDVRKNKAIHFLTESNIPLDEIGFRLGFKEASAFFRAFKAWFNLTPGQYRKQSSMKFKKA